MGYFFFLLFIQTIYTTYRNYKARSYVEAWWDKCNHNCAGAYSTCSPYQYWGSEECGYPSHGGDCANFVSQCLVEGGHGYMNGHSTHCRGYCGGKVEPGAKRLGDCLALVKGWKRKCGYHATPPNTIKVGDVLIFHKVSCSGYGGDHATIVTDVNNNPPYGANDVLLSGHSSSRHNVPYTNWQSSMPYLEWLEYQGSPIKSGATCVAAQDSVSIRSTPCGAQTGTLSAGSKRMTTGKTSCCCWGFVWSEYQGGGWSARDYLKDATGCDSCSPTCKNGGTCSGTICSCTSSWSGPDCTTPVCSPACNSHSFCSAPNKCTCKSGWSGTTCQTPTCSPACTGHSSCTSPNTCTCDAGWVGSSCQYEEGTCMGSCDPVYEKCLNDKCVCIAGYSGTDCQTPVCNDPYVCNKKQECTSPNTCSCREGWEGEDCQMRDCHGTFSGLNCTECLYGWTHSELMEDCSVYLFAGGWVWVVPVGITFGVFFIILCIIVLIIIVVKCRRYKGLDKPKPSNIQIGEMDELVASHSDAFEVNQMKNYVKGDKMAHPHSKKAKPISNVEITDIHDAVKSHSDGNEFEAMTEYMLGGRKKKI